MSSHPALPRHIATLLLIAAGLLALVFCLPDAGGLYGGNFVQAALNSSWRQLVEPAAAWGSLKLIVASVALYLLIEAVATLLGKLKLTRLAIVVFCLQAVAVVGVLAGGYYLCKALL